MVFSLTMKLVSHINKPCLPPTLTFQQIFQPNSHLLHCKWASFLLNRVEATEDLVVVAAVAAPMMVDLIFLTPVPSAKFVPSSNMLLLSATIASTIHSKQLLLHLSLPIILLFPSSPLTPLGTQTLQQPTI